MEVFSMPKRILALAGAGVAALALTVVAASIAFAQVTPPPPNGTFLTRVAQILGIDRARLEAATKQASLEQVDEEVRAGRLTAEEATKLKSAIEKGEAGVVAFGAAGGGPFEIRVAGPFAGAAKLLGLTEEQLQQELQGGKTLAQVAADHGVGRDQLIQALVAEHNKQLDEAVASGRMPREVADRLRADSRTMIESLIDGKPGQGLRVSFGHDIVVPH
jgi:ribosomal protein S13